MTNNEINLERIKKCASEYETLTSFFSDIIENRFIPILHEIIRNIDLKPIDNYHVRNAFPWHDVYFFEYEGIAYFDDVCVSAIFGEQGDWSTNVVFQMEIFFMDYETLVKYIEKELKEYMEKVQIAEKNKNENMKEARRQKYLELKKEFENE